MTISCPASKVDHTRWCTRLWWRRLERRARREFDRELLAALRELAEARTPVVGVVTDPVGAARFTLPGRTLTLARVDVRAAEPLSRQLLAGSPLRVSTAGRYGRLWWVAVWDGESETVLAGLHVRLSHGGGGAGEAEGPPGGLVAEIYKYEPVRV